MVLPTTVASTVLSIRLKAMEPAMATSPETPAPAAIVTSVPLSLAVELNEEA